MAITIDTHALVWYLDKGLNSKLSKKAFQFIKNAEKNDVIYISVIILVELLYLIEKGRVNLAFNQILEKIENSRNYQIISLDVELLKTVATLEQLETHDRIIMAVAQNTQTPLVSKDRTIQRYYSNVIWD